MKPRITPQIQRLIETDQLNPNNLGSRVQWIKVYSSEKHNKDNFNLKKIRINASKLCSGRYNLPLKVNKPIEQKILQFSTQPKKQNSTESQTLLRPNGKPMPSILLIVHPIFPKKEKNLQKNFQNFTLFWFLKVKIPLKFKGQPHELQRRRH